MAEQHNYHCPIKKYWEGTGERFIQELKKVLLSMCRNYIYFFRKDMYNVSKEHDLVVVKKNYDEDGDDYKYTTKKIQTRDYYHYESLKEVKHKFNTGRVLSGFTYEALGTKVMIVYGNERRPDQISAVGIDRLGATDGKMLMGVVYTKYELDLTNSHFVDENLIAMEKVMTDYCLLLPMVVNGVYKKEYTLVYSDWDIRDLSL